MKISELTQGIKFIYNNKTCMKLPEYVTCYDQPATAVDIITGTMLYIEPNVEVEAVLDTRVGESVNKPFFIFRFKAYNDGD